MNFGAFKSEYYAQKPVYAYAAGDILYPGVIHDHYKQAIWKEPIRNRFCNEGLPLNAKCRCGIWGYKDCDELAKTEKGLMVVMVLMIEGEILEFEQGYIGESGIITKIYVASPRLLNTFGERILPLMRHHYPDVEVDRVETFWANHAQRREQSEAELFEEWKKERTEKIHHPGTDKQGHSIVECEERGCLK